MSSANRGGTRTGDSGEERPSTWIGSHRHRRGQLKVVTKSALIIPFICFRNNCVTDLMNNQLVNELKLFKH